MRVLPIAVLIGVMAGGCSDQSDREKGASPEAPSAEDVREEASEAVDASVDYAASKKEEYEREVADKLARIDKRLARLKEQVADAGEEAGAELRDTVDRLSEKRQEVQSELARLRERAPDAWRELRDGLNAAVADLDKALKDAVAQFSDQQGD